jgi:uncharacterized protein (TIGR02147 family)
MKSVLEYLDYRQYLRDWFAGKKKANPRYSLRALSNRAGFKAADFPYRVMHGERNLTGSSLFKLVEAIGLKGKELEYFEELVKFNQAVSAGERDYHARKVVALRAALIPAKDVPRLEPEQYEFYSKWWHTVVRCILGQMDIRDEWEKLGRQLHPPISPAAAKKSVLLLARLGMVHRDEIGYWKPVERVFSTGIPIVPLALKSFHAATTRLSDRAREELPQDDQSLTSLTLGIHRKAFKQVKEMVRAMSAEILEKLSSGEIGKGIEEDGDRMVYHLQLHLFPMTRSGAPD